MDNQTKTQVGVFAESDINVSEPVFVANPDADVEDDGVILSLLTKDFEQHYAGLLILDAKTFKEIGRVEMKAKGPVTGTLHGTFNMNAGGERVFKNEEL